jgi:hypothetical protein
VGATWLSNLVRMKEKSKRRTTRLEVGLSEALLAIAGG